MIPSTLSFKNQRNLRRIGENEVEEGKIFCKKNMFYYFIVYVLF